MVDRRLIDVPRAALERSADGARLRRRIGALGACGAVVAAALAMVGLGEIVLAGVVVLAAGAAGAAAADALRRSGTPHGPRAQGALRAAAAALALGGRRLLGELLWAATTARAVGATAVGAAGHARRRAAVRARTARRARSSLRDALQLNAIGVDLRRRGEPTEAVECHRAALTILQELGDTRAVALTQSNIALALEQTGNDGEAVERFEHAISLLREVGDCEREGQVTANLGVVHLRHGRRDVAQELLLAALEKLGPDSAAHAQVERQLRRAS
jgi:tetratricopeptide (TPR) repeat protein